MAANQLIAPLAPLTVDPGATITVEAINPSTGAAVSGVTVSQVTIFASAGGVPILPTAIDPLYVYQADE